MKILVIGSGGREHAICNSFAKGARVSRLISANGNAGIAAIAECIPTPPDDVDSLAEFAERESIDLTFVGGEGPLALGIVDEFERRGLRIIGPGRKAARLESSKAYAKEFMTRHNIPTARYAVAETAGEAVRILVSGVFSDEDSPVVVKADGLAAGKGVIVANDRRAAVAACDDLAKIAGGAADKIILEECLTGSEISLLMFADGEDFALMPPVRDHKRIGEGDTGPNTGGMGTITDSALISADDIREITEKVIRPTLSGCIRDGHRFRGILFLGLMMTREGPRVLEYNVRFGDPETQAILVRLKTDLADICEAMLDGKLAGMEIEWSPGSSACVVLASDGYPGKARTGDEISGLDAASAREGVTIFHAATSRMAAGTHAAGAGSTPLPAETGSRYVTAGGRVLGVTAVGDDLATALARAYEAVSDIRWDGMQYRRDIGSQVTRRD